MRILPAELFAFLLPCCVKNISAGISPGHPSDAPEGKLSVPHPLGGEVTHFLGEAENLCERLWPHAWHTARVPRKCDELDE